MLIYLFGQCWNIFWASWGFLKMWAVKQRAVTFLDHPIYRSVPLQMHWCSLAVGNKSFSVVYSYIVEKLFTIRLLDKVVSMCTYACSMWTVLECWWLCFRNICAKCGKLRSCPTMTDSGCQKAYTVSSFAVFIGYVRCCDFLMLQMHSI